MTLDTAEVLPSGLLIIPFCFLNVKPNMSRLSNLEQLEMEARKNGTKLSRTSQA
jgi:hypothetical protein